MDEADCFKALSHVVAVTPGWTAEAVEEVVDQLIDLASADALERACQDIARSWDQLMRPPIATILKAYDDAYEAIGMRAIDPARVHCDGSGYRYVDAELVPCERCNPAHAAIRRDPDKYRRWAHGESLHLLDVDVEQVAGRLRWKRERPQRCYPADDRPEDIVTDVDRIREIQWAAYAEQAVELGRIPDRRHFDRLIGAIHDR